MAGLSDGVRGPRWLREEILSLVLFLLWVDYLLIAAIVWGRAVNGAFTDRQQAVLLAGFGLLAPVAAWACRVHIERVAGPQPDTWWWRAGRWNLHARTGPGIGARRADRLHGLALAAGSLALFWMLYAGSLLAGAVLPVAVWTLVLVRLRRRDRRPPAS